VRRALAAFAVLLVAGCGSGGAQPSGPVVNSPGSGPTQPPTPLVNVKVTVTVPQAKKGARLRSNYVSVNTQSLAIELSSVNGQGVSGVSTTTIDTMAHAHGCAQQANGLVCSATALGSPGDDVFAVTTYAGTNATGPVLSVGTVSAKITSTGGGVPIDNNVPLTLAGVIASVTLTVSPDGAKRGTPSTASVNLNAVDASGAQIVGASDYQTPIALAIQGDVDNAFTLRAGTKSGESLTIVKPDSGITLRYDGNKNASPVTLEATVVASIGASANFALRGKQPPPPVGTIYALNLSADDGLGATVTEYAGKASGNAAPERTLQLDSKLYARSIAVDADGNLYVGYFDTALGYQIGTGQPDTGNEIAVYAPDASGNATPIAVIASDSATQTALFPIFTSFDPSDDLVTYGATAIDQIAGSDAVLTYSAPSKGPTVPSEAFSISSPGVLYYGGPTGLQLDSTGNFYLNTTLHAEVGPTYGLFAVPSSDNGKAGIVPTRTIPWNGTTELTPGETTNVSLDDAGEIFIANVSTAGSGSGVSCQGRANVYSAGDGGGSTNLPPLRVLTLSGIYIKSYQCISSHNALQPFFPTIDVYGTTLFVADDFNNTIDEFSASAGGTVKPFSSIAGSSTQLDGPIALVLTKNSGQAKARPARPLDALSYKQEETDK